MSRDELPPHLIPIRDGESDHCVVTFDHFGQRDLAREQLFREIHKEILRQDPADYRPETYRKFWDLCELQLGRWVAEESDYAMEDAPELVAITEAEFGERGGVGCFAMVSLDWDTHGETVASSIDLQLNLFGEVVFKYVPSYEVTTYGT